MRAHSGKTENGSTRRRVLLAGWFVNCQEFSQVDRTVGVEAIVSTIVVSSQNDGAETICLLH